MKKIILCCWLAVSLFPPVLMGEEPSQVKEMIQTGMAHLQNKEYEPAIDVFKKALELKPNLPEIHNALGVAYLNTEGSTNHALASFEEAVRLKPKYAEAYFNIGLTYAYHRDDPVTAKEYFQKAIDLDPSLAKAYQALGLVYLMAEHNPIQAVKLFKTAIQLDPRLAAAHFSLGLSYIMMGKPSQALGPISDLRRFNQEGMAVALEKMLRGEGSLGNRSQADEAAQGENPQNASANPSSSGGEASQNTQPPASMPAN